MGRGNAVSGHDRYIPLKTRVDRDSRLRATDGESEAQVLSNLVHRNATSADSTLCPCTLCIGLLPDRVAGMATCHAGSHALDLLPTLQASNLMGAFTTALECGPRGVDRNSAAQLC